MSPEIIKKYRQYCELTITDLVSLQEINDQEFWRNPADGGWNLSQVFDHLVSLEKAVYLYMSKKTQTIDGLHTVNTKNKYRSFLLQLFLKLPKKFKVPSVLPQPSETKNVATLMSEFESVRAKTLKLIESLPNETNNKLVFRHPAAGYLTFTQTVGFLREHWAHHKKQIKRLTH